MSKKRKKRELLNKERLIQQKRRIDREIKSLRLQGVSDANPKIQDLEAEKAQILRWAMYHDGTGSRPVSLAKVREFPNLGGRRARKQNTPMLRLAEATLIAARGNTVLEVANTSLSATISDEADSV